jgi:hypothetical protein
MATKRRTAPKEPWTCPRCGLEGDGLKSPDPKRCLSCCRIDAADALCAALDAMVAAFKRRTPLSTHAADLLLKTGESALARARGES